jgi:hypothetical protein
MLRIIVEECHNNLMCCFIDFRKYFETIPSINLYNRLEELKVHFKLRVIVTSLYENIISKCTNSEGYLKEINCYI